MQPETPAMVQPKDSTESCFLRQLETVVGKRNFEHWFQDRIHLECDGDNLSIGVASPFLVSWMQKQFRRPIAQVAHEVYGPAIRVRFEVDSRISLPTAVEKPTEGAARKQRGKSSLSHQRPTAAKASKPGKRRFADLADFVSGPCNELPLTASLQVGDAPGTSFNPLFLYGSVGVGKTHLLEGVYRRLRRKFPAAQVMFLTSEAFTNYFVQALREHTLPSFRRRFRNVDVLLVDDVDFLGSKRAIQEEFLHTFKQLESHGRQIVLTADRHPRLLTKLSEELTTRFLSGLVCRVEAPDVETRKQIVRRKASRLNAEISDEALDFVAERF